jgi:hypothetical protein
MVRNDRYRDADKLFNKHEATPEDVEDPRPPDGETQIYETAKCGQPRRRNEGVCQLPAGWGTDHPGEGACKKHGGNNAYYLKKLSLKKAKENMLQESERTFGRPIFIDPHTALLQEVQRTAGHIFWLGEKIAQIGEINETEALQQWTLAGIKPSFWVETYQEERRHLVRVSKAAIDAGVAERQVAVAEEQGKLIAMAIRAILWDSDMQLSPAQRQAAPAIIRRHLLALPVGDQHGYPAEIVQAETVPSE